MCRRLYRIVMTTYRLLRSIVLSVTMMYIGKGGQRQLFNSDGVAVLYINKDERG
jgi:hypothetical protein